MDMELTSKEDKLRVLEALKQASHYLQLNPTPYSDDSAIKALLELQLESDSILSIHPNLFTLSRHLFDLKTRVQTLQSLRGGSLKNFLTRRVSSYSISRLAMSIESEIQNWIDRESFETLTKALKEEETCKNNQDQLIHLLVQFEDRVSIGFNRELQDLVPKSKVISSLESVLCNANLSKRIREHAAFGIAALIRFNKDVFVGQVLMGATIHALLTMESKYSMKVLLTLIKSIKSPLVDEIESNGEIPKIISMLNSKEIEMRVLAMECILEIGYFGRKEAIEAMIKEGLTKKLVELQRSDMGGDLIEKDRFDKEEDKVRYPFAMCVARFAVQLEVGEGLRQREKRKFKQEILVKVREASISHAETATIFAQVLWGSSP